jgi:hypothetical protein
MNTRQILKEETYNIGHIADEIYKDVIEPFIKSVKAGGKFESTGYDISEYMKPIFRKYTDLPFTILLFFRQSIKPVAQWYINIQGLRAKILLAITKEDLKSLNTKEIKDKMLGFLVHEITHATDRMRLKSQKEFMGSVDPTDNWYNYIKDPTETNAYFHQFVTLAKKDKSYYNKIASMERLENYLLWRMPQMIDLKDENPNGFKAYFKRFVKRLARENMLPNYLLSKSS